jgi:hypothetical protein
MDYEQVEVEVEVVELEADVEVQQGLRYFEQQAAAVLLKGHQKD